MLSILDETVSTAYAPLNTPIDGDRDYGMNGLDGCNCGYQGLDEALFGLSWMQVYLIAAGGAAALWWYMRNRDYQDEF